LEPTASQPWRVLESTPVDTAPGSTPTATSGDPARPSGAIAVRVGIIAAATIAIAAIAIVLAGTTDGGTVRVDGDSVGGTGATADLGQPGSSGANLSNALVVEIVGAVAKPGVYRLERGARVGDLLRAAGGYGPRVDTARLASELNLAAELTDGGHIRIPSRDDPAGTAGPHDASGGASAGALVDLNRATQAGLEALPGVGPATATKIITAREEAPFTSVDELRSRGILGEKTFAKLRDLVTAG
jgi:competence protein ComEA